MSAINPEVDSAVRSLFSVTDYVVAEEGAAEYSIVYDSTTSGENFVKLLELLKAPDYSAQLNGDPERATLVVVKNRPLPEAQQAVRLSAPAFLFLLALLSLLVTGYVVAVIFPQVSPGGSSLKMGAGFVLGLVALFATRYLAQSYVARSGSGFSFSSYYLPNVPIFIALPTMYFLPTFGAASFPGSLPANKNKLFDFFLVGAVATLVVAVVVAILGASSCVVLTQAQYLSITNATGTATIETNPSVIQGGVIYLAQSLGMMPHTPQGGTLIFSPIEIAAWLGFLLAFFNLLPAGLFDGGRMSHLALGERWGRVAAVLSALLLLLTDLPDYWVVFLVIFLMGAFPAQGETLDSISELSRSRKVIFASAVVLALLCIPIPQSFATFTL